MVDSVAKCNNCGACEREVVFPQGVAQKHQIVRCMKCGLMYAYPRATAAIAQYVAAGKTGEPMTLQTPSVIRSRSEEHTSELQSQFHLVCRLLLEKKKKKKK